jgi:hypothetical protein
MEDRYNYLSFVIDREIDKYVEYMLENTKSHVMDPGNEMLIQTHAADYEDIDFDTIAAKIATVTLVPNWPVIFQADNHLDSGKKSLDQQRELIGTLIEDLRASGKVSDSHLPKGIAKVINEEFLTEPLKVRALIAELTAEYNLCKRDISWTDALKERIRVACYSILLCANSDLVGTLYAHSAELEKFGIRVDLPANQKAVDEKILENLKKELKEIIGKGKNGEKILSALESGAWAGELEGATDACKEEYEIIQTFCILSICIAIGDDYLDMAEDVENNKITGITRALEMGIPAENVFRTSSMYLMVFIMKNPWLKMNAKLFLINLINVITNNPKKFMEACISRCPKFLSNIFQRA